MRNLRRHLTDNVQPTKPVLVTRRAIGPGKVHRIPYPFDDIPNKSAAIEGSAEDVANLAAAEKIAAEWPKGATYKDVYGLNRPPFPPTKDYDFQRPDFVETPVAAPMIKAPQTIPADISKASRPKPRPRSSWGIPTLPPRLRS